MTTAVWVTPAEYLAQEAQAAYKSEYHDGVIVPMAGASVNHMHIQSNVHAMLYHTLSEEYVVWTSDVQIRIPATNRYVYPDVVVVHGQPEVEAGTPIAVLLNPLLIAEVLSVSSQGYDQQTKFSHYQTIPTFREYLLLNQYQVEVRHWWRTDDNPTWQQAVYASRADQITLQSVPVVVPLAQAYRRVTL